MLKINVSNNLIIFPSKFESHLTLMGSCGWIDMEIVDKQFFSDNLSVFVKIKH